MKGGAQGGGGGAGVMVSIPNNSNNLINQLSKTIKQIEDGINGYRSWLCKQSLPIETAVVTTTNAIGGAAIGAVYGSLANNNPFFSVILSNSNLYSYRVFRGGPLLQARDIAVMKGVEACVSCVLKRVKGKEDLETSMVAAFGSGAALSLVTDLGGPNLAVNAAGLGFLFALAEVGFFQVKQKCYPSLVEHSNCEQGFLIDSTIPLLTDRQV
ncbi:hypothetical protein MKW94_014604 [Papaver nudicaule]|uniref:Uncharacterized protein n=1 Tax=Papaver nudicaule TaxID=74823 RepID=A0AA41VNB9_PAPNU|nr:hypothetical protein [Papaver nudicaule]